MLIRSLRTLAVCALVLVAVVPALAQGAEATASLTPVNVDLGLVVARVGDAQFTLGDMQRIIDEQQMYRSNPADDRSRLRVVLDDWIVDRLVAEEAKSVSLKGMNGILARVRRSMILVAAEAYLNDSATQRFQLDSATIDTFYHNHISRYSIDHNQRRVRVISVWKEGKRPSEELVAHQDSLYANWYPEDKIDTFYTRLCAGEDFDQLARMHSEDYVTRERGGEMGWVSTHSLGGGVFGDLAMTQPLHLISRPFETETSWHILQATDERPAGPVPLDDAIRKDITQALTEQQSTIILKQIGDSLKATAVVKWNDATKDLRHDQLEDDMVLAVVHGRDTIYAIEFLQDEKKWMDMNTGAMPSPEKRAEIVLGEYVPYLCWLTLARAYGYHEHPLVVSLLEDRLRQEREAIVRVRMVAAPGGEPDSLEVRRYFEAHPEVYGTAPGALTFNWNIIKGKLLDERAEQARRRWEKAAAARHPIVRYDERLSMLELLAPGSTRR